MTTLDTLLTGAPDRDEVADAALAMADFDAKSGNYATALDWLGVAADHRDSTPEYRAKKDAWETGALPAAPPDTRGDAITAAALTVIRRTLVEGAPMTREALEREASVNLIASREEAIRELDAVAQRVGVSGLG
jgi:hypothetical protein